MSIGIYFELYAFGKSLSDPNSPAFVSNRLEVRYVTQN